MLMGFGGVDSSAFACVPSKTQSVETSTNAAPASAAAVAALRVEFTYASHAARRSEYSRPKSLRMAQWMTTSGAFRAMLARTAPSSTMSTRWVAYGRLSDDANE